MNKILFILIALGSFALGAQAQNYGPSLDDILAKRRAETDRQLREIDERYERQRLIDAINGVTDAIESQGR
jgi:hypothetical protein